MAYQMGMLSSFLPGYLLSGFIYSIHNMPKVIQVVSYHRSRALLRHHSERRVSERRGIPDPVARSVCAGHLRRLVFWRRVAKNEAEGGLIMRERLLGIIRKEFRQALREPRMRSMLFIPPLIQLFVFGFAVNLDVDHARMAWMDLDRTLREPRTAGRVSRARGRFDVVADARQRSRSAAAARCEPGRSGGPRAARLRARLWSAAAPPRCRF